MPVMLPATSDWNLPPSSTAAGSPPSRIAGTGLEGQMVKDPAVTVATPGLADAKVTWLVTFCVLESEYVPVAVNCCVPPPGTVGPDGPGRHASSLRERQTRRRSEDPLAPFSQIRGQRLRSRA